MKPLVSILIPAYNAEKWIREAIQSALSQTWPYKEIIVVDDGSTDSTDRIVRSFGPRITLISTENRGLSSAVNHALRRAQGDYIQELDADDCLLPNKIEKQLSALREGDSKRILLSSPWAPFFYRTRGVQFVKNSFWEDLTPVEWLLRKMTEGTHMQNATWLVSRELAEAAGPWDETLQYDQDGEYFTRVIAASEGTRFVPETGILYRITGTNRISYIGRSSKKKESLYRSMKVHMRCLQSLEDSERIRKACVAYMQIWYGTFYPSMPKIAAEMNALAAEFGGWLEEPRLARKYSWMGPIVGRGAAQWAQMTLPQLKLAAIRRYDRLMYKLENAKAPSASELM